MPRLFKRRGGLRQATEELLAKVSEAVEETEIVLELLRKEEKVLKAKLEEYE
jgi:hypothetical protein